MVVVVVGSLWSGSGSSKRSLIGLVLSEALQADKDASESFQDSDGDRLLVLIRKEEWSWSCMLWSEGEARSSAWSPPRFPPRFFHHLLLLVVVLLRLGVVLVVCCVVVLFLLVVVRTKRHDEAPGNTRGEFLLGLAFHVAADVVPTTTNDLVDNTRGTAPLVGRCGRLARLGGEPFVAWFAIQPWSNTKTKEEDVLEDPRCRLAHSEPGGTSPVRKGFPHDPRHHLTLFTDDPHTSAPFAPIA